MELSEDVKRLLDRRVNGIINNIDVYEKDKQEIRKELISHFYDASAFRATTRGSIKIEKEDVEAVFAGSEAPEEVASEYMRSYLTSFERAGILSRAFAFGIDLIIYAFCLIIVLPPFFIASFLIGPEHNIINTFIAMLEGLCVLAIGFVCFIVIEAQFGTTPGKSIVGLRALKIDGTRIGYKESILRNVPKIINGLIFIDAILMLLLFRKDKQRAFDKVASTIVVHSNKKAANDKI